VHEAKEDFTVGESEIRIPGGTWLIGNIWGAHHCPKTWENPEMFKPQRFLDANGKFNTKLMEHCVTFSVGMQMNLMYFFQPKNFSNFSFDSVKCYRCEALRG